MSALFDEVKALVSTRLMYIVDTVTGTWDEYTAEDFIIVAPLLDDSRFQPRMSLKSALELSHKVVTERAGKN